MRITTPVLLVLLSLASSTTTVSGAESPDKAASEDIFNQRILPIFRSPNPSSCVQCHLASVDLKDYILPSSDQTFVSLRDQGLVDLDHPEQSKILTLIRMGEKDTDDEARLIHQKMRDAERTAFTAWIAACCNDQRLRTLPTSSEIARPDHPDGVIRHARKSRIVDSFVRNVWSQRMRCFPCHTPYEIDSENPKHKMALKRQSEFAEIYDDEMLKRLHFFRETPEATLEFLLSESESTPDDRLPVINVLDPMKSLLILKPTSKLPKRSADKTFDPPTYIEPISHMGGLKLHKNDQSYKSFLSWLRDYSNLTQGKYKSVNDLPADNWLATKKVLRLAKVPKDWETGTVFQMFVYKQGQAEPLAFTQGTVTPRHMVNGALFLLGRTRQDHVHEFPKLEPGSYLVKAYVDRSGKVALDPTAMLGDEDFVGQSLLDAQWREGFRFAEKIDAKDLKQALAEKQVGQPQ